MANATTSSWPPREGLTTQNVPRKDAILTTSASIRINAPADKVFHVLRHVADYPSWNTFCPRATIQVQPMQGDGEATREFLELGTIFTLQAVMDSKKPDKTFPTQVKVSDISTPEQKSTYIPVEILESDGSYSADLDSVYRISWKVEGGLVAKGLKTERVNEITRLSDTECEARTWELQGGLLANTVKWMYQKTLMERFQLWCEDLKKHCENMAEGNVT